MEVDLQLKYHRYNNHSLYFTINFNFIASNYFFLELLEL